MDALAAYRGLLTNRPLSLLLGGESVSAIGEWLYVVAILIVIYSQRSRYPSRPASAALEPVRHPSP